MLKFILPILSYLLGSIPFGFLIAYWVRGIDIRNFGSGNIGATNVVRMVGKKWGILVFVLDFLKGVAAPCITARWLAGADFIIIVSAILVVCGHNWTIFLGFRGGKGVSASLGAVAGLGFIFPALWIVLGISLVVWLVVFRISKYVSVASLAAAASLFIFSLVFPSLPNEIKVFSFLLLVFIVIRHKKNIQDLLTKREKRF